MPKEHKSWEVDYIAGMESSEKSEKLLGAIILLGGFILLAMLAWKHL